MFEKLENRPLLAAVASVRSAGVLTITGTAAADNIYVSYQVAGNKINVNDGSGVLKSHRRQRGRKTSPSISPISPARRPTMAKSVKKISPIPTSTAAKRKPRLPNGGTDTLTTSPIVDVVNTIEAYF